MASYPSVGDERCLYERRRLDANLVCKKHSIDECMPVVRLAWHQRPRERPDPVP